MKTKRLTENDINRLVYKVLNEDTNEGIFDPVKDVYHGLKGVWRGEGYDYFKYLSSLRNQVRTLKSLDRPNEKIFHKLEELKKQISSSKMNAQKKQNITNAIDSAMSHFDQYQQILDTIETLISQKIN